MSWEVGENADGRDVGYGVPSICDQPGCGRLIDRGLSYVCGDMHDGGDHGCGRYFCEDHLTMGCRQPKQREAEDDEEWVQLCDRCIADLPPHTPTPDTREWLDHKLNERSWASWRREHPEQAEVARQQLESLRLPEEDPIWRAAISAGPVEHNGTGFWAVHEGGLLPHEDTSPPTEQAA